MKAEERKKINIKVEIMEVGNRENREKSMKAKAGSRD